MKNLTLGLLGLALLAGTFGAGCIENDGRRYGGYYYPTCQKFVTCDGCTRALGCGWCMSGTKGLCVSEPNQCATAESFSFNWEPTGCPGGGATDGGIDYGAPVEPSSTDGGTSKDVAPAADAPADTAIATDAAAD
jgi:Plexin repeat